jgi:endonuclease/exonuclease/phosphatase family metal-dependent hydrolase
MGGMTDTPPEVRAEIDGVTGAVAAQVPTKAADNLLIATWNLRAFGNLTPAWNTGAGSRPKRDWRAVALIAAVVSHFDVVAVQEVRRNLTALRFLVSQLGPAWRLVTSDVTVGDDGNDERLTFVYDSTRVQPSGLVGELVLPPTLNQPVRQFARSPYAVSFRRGEVDFILTTAHIIWGGRAEDRLPEITELAKWMRTWADRRNDWNVNLLVLGDFNLDRLRNPLFDAFVSTGLWPPAELNDIPRTIFDNNRNRHFYDQIAWFTDVEADPPVDLLTEMTYTRRAGSFDFLPHVFSGLTARDVSWRISDHYPLWAEFRLAP